jgi:23S rRNA (adenine2030-N6)-methyltransferase
VPARSVVDAAGARRLTGCGATAGAARERCRRLMNYRHAFHAGNFADVFKHAILTRILVHLREKPAPFRVIDLHAGAGLYDLTSEESDRTGEWRDGIGRLFAADLRPKELAPEPAALLAPYLATVRAFNPDGVLRHYPGSPLVVGDLLRAHDRLIACELEPTAAAALARRLHGVRQAKAVAIDGWVALNAYIPPSERRGLVLLDPSYEEVDEFPRLAAALSSAWRKWRTGIYMAWYPIKSRGGPDALARVVARGGIEKALRLEMTTGPIAANGPLAGCGLLVVNPPWRLAEEAELVLGALVELFGGAGRHRIDWISAEPER